VNRLNWLALLSLATLAACDTSKLTRAAEGTRDAAEHLVENAQTASSAREANVMEQARTIEQQEAHLLAMENGGRPRYEIRKEGNSWTVYDTENNRPAHVGVHAQTGLDHDHAVEVFQDLQNEEELENARMGPPDRPIKLRSAR
jgi:hypothetical protein